MTVTGANRSVEFVTPPCARVELLALTEQPEKVLALLARGYAQVYEPEISPEETTKYLDDLSATKLKTPLGFLNAIFLVRDVSRALTHQLVRTRVGASFVQESLRFSVHDTVRVLLPPNVANGVNATSLYCEAAERSVRSYHELIEGGYPAEEARGLLPTNTLTSIFVGYSLQTLAHVYNQRMCCQAQHGEWQAMLDLMITQVEERAPQLMGFFQAPWEDPNTVSCGFGASFDRPCTKQALFDANLRALAADRLQ